MPAAHSFAVFAVFLNFLSTFCQSKPLRAPGSRAIDARNWNLTSISISPATSIVAVDAALSSSLPIEQPQFPTLGTGTAAANASATDNGLPRPTDERPKNNTCGSCTVHVPQANLNWWYPVTYQYDIGTLTLLKQNFTSRQYASLVPATAPFDVVQTIAGVGYSASVQYYPEYNDSWTWLEEYTIKPTAQVTSVVTRTAALPLPSGNIFPVEDLTLYDTDPWQLFPAEAAVTGAAGTVYIATSTTPYIYFSAYAVETNVPVTLPNGEVEYDTSFQTFDLDDTYVYTIRAKDVENVPIASGRVPEDFMRQIPQSLCCVGTYTAVVTVIVVVDLTYFEEIGVIGDPMLVHIEKPATGFEEESEAKNTGESNPNAIQTMDDPYYTTSFPKVRVESSVLPGRFSEDRYAGSNVVGHPAEPTDIIVGTIGLAPVKFGPSSEVVVGSQTLTPGSIIQISGTPVSMASSGTAPAIVVGGTTSVLARPIFKESPAPPILTIGSSTFTGNAATQFSVGPGQILTPGGTAMVGGTPVSLESHASFVVVGGSTQALPRPIPAVTTAAQIVVVGKTITANPGGSTYVVSGQTLAPGRAIIVDGNTLSLDAAASNIIVNGATKPVLFQPLSPAPVLTLGSSQITANSGSSFVISGQTLAPGGTITVSGTTIALGPSASFVVIDGFTSSLSSPAQATITPPPLTIGNGVFTALSDRPGISYIIGGQTLTPGGTITVAGSTISLSPGASILLVNGKPTTLIASPTITSPPLLTIGSKTFSAEPGSGTTFVIGSQTLTPGGVITVDGTTISLAPGATRLVYGGGAGSTTQTLFPATTMTASTGGSATAVPKETKKGGVGRSCGVWGKNWISPVLVAVWGLVLF